MTNLRERLETNQFHDPDAGVRRFLDDLRSGVDRRSWFERRKHRMLGDRLTQDAERRDEHEERRSGPHDRRKPPAGPFGPADHERIVALLGDPSLPADCPRCGAVLLRSELLRDGRPTPVIQCTGCRRRAELS